MSQLISSVSADESSNQLGTLFLSRLEELLEERLKPLMEMQQQLINQNITLSTRLDETLKIQGQGETSGRVVRTSTTTEKKREPRVASKSRSKAKDITIDRNKAGVLIVSGKTYDVRPDLKKDFGALWQPDDFHWLLDADADIEAVKEVCEKYEKTTVICANAEF